MVQDFPKITLQLGWVWVLFHECFIYIYIYIYVYIYIYIDFLSLFFVCKALSPKVVFLFSFSIRDSVHNEISPGVDGSDSGLLGFARQVADEVRSHVVTSWYATWFFWTKINRIKIENHDLFILCPPFFDSIFWKHINMVSWFSTWVSSTKDPFKSTQSTSWGWTIGSSLHVGGADRMGTGKDDSWNILGGGNEKKIFYFQPVTWGDDPIWLVFFQMGGSTTN